MSGCPGNTRLYLLDGWGILFNEYRQDLYVLNATAAFVWCCLEDGLERDQAVAAVEAGYGVPATATQTEIDALLHRWEELGLLAGTEHSRTPKPPRREEEEPDLGEWVHSVPLPSYRERSYRLLTTSFWLRYATAAQEATVHPVLAHLETPGPGPKSATPVDLVCSSGAHFLLLNARCKERCEQLDELAPLVKGALLAAAINNYSYLLYVHAGVVRSACGCLLLPGAAGSGKTSLTAALVHAGFAYLSDEVALLEEDTLQVRPVPVSLCIKDSAWDLLAPYYPELHDLAIHHRWDSKVVRYLNPPLDALDPEPERSHPIRWIIFPQYAPAVRTELRPVRKVYALQRLLKQCLAMPVPLDQAKVASLVRWISEIPCYELPMSSLDDAVALVNDLCQRPATD